MLQKRKKENEKGKQIKKGSREEVKQKFMEKLVWSGKL